MGNASEKNKKKDAPRDSTDPIEQVDSLRDHHLKQKNINHHLEHKNYTHLNVPKNNPEIERGHTNDGTTETDKRLGMNKPRKALVF